jgi:hypothetical protein
MILDERTCWNLAWLSVDNDVWVLSWPRIFLDTFGNVMA